MNDASTLGSLTPEPPRNHPCLYIYIRLYCLDLEVWMCDDFWFHLARKAYSCWLDHRNEQLFIMLFNFVKYSIDYW